MIVMCDKRDFPHSKTALPLLLPRRCCLSVCPSRYLRRWPPLSHDSREHHLHYMPSSSQASMSALHFRRRQINFSIKSAQIVLE
jgi:hypothetical protein